MVRSSIFNQAPDWAKILGDSYTSVNASEDRNEQLEKQNDAVRIANAGDAIKVFAAIADFSSTAKKLAQANEKKKKGLEDFGILARDSENVDINEKATTESFTKGLQLNANFKYHYFFQLLIGLMALLIFILVGLVMMFIWFNP